MISTCNCWRGNGNQLQYSCLGKSHGQRSLMGYSLWDHKRVGHGVPNESDTTKWLTNKMCNCTFGGGFHLISLVRQLWFLSTSKHPWNKLSRYFSSSWTRDHFPLFAHNTDGVREGGQHNKSIATFATYWRRVCIWNSRLSTRACHAHRMTQGLHFYKTATFTHLKVIFT